MGCLKIEIFDLKIVMMKNYCSIISCSILYILTIPGRDKSVFRQDLTLSQSVCLSDDSDGEADRRQAVMFKKFDTIDPDQDVDLIKDRAKHTRAKSLPPPMYICVEPPPEEEEEEIAESCLDRRPSHLRNQLGSDPYVRNKIDVKCLCFNSQPWIIISDMPALN